ncbi:MAG: histone methyltransferase set2 [Watsoniomyces obsoletus]|nr:MAG: histone methyltransferase set2 [Watsoniomyces obsoletus]
MAAILNQVTPVMDTGMNGQESRQVTLSTAIKQESKSSTSVKAENGMPENYGFHMLEGCTYTPKALGSSDQEALGCDCSEERVGDRNVACGEESDCINRLTKVECVDDECNCGAACQNQRFQLRQWADVAVIKTEKKGRGLEAKTDLHPNDFIYEYVGEVINEASFRRRMIQYDEEGITHFYFMSLQKGVFIDATKKGNLGRFCNHSCNPNCYVDKWVVGDKLRMGIFAKRRIRAGEELVFNYNVDRYGADPQPCYCGESNCTGFIGGKTQTERATKLPSQTLEALGIDDDGDDWDLAVPKKVRRKRAGEDDADYVDRQDIKALDEYAVTQVIPTLMQCKERWIVVKLLERIQQCDSDGAWNQLVRLHGYRVMNSTLQRWTDDVNIVLQVLDILSHLPRLTRNKIVDAKIEPTLQNLSGSDDERVQRKCQVLLDEWSNLEMGYRIPRKMRDPNDPGRGPSTPDRPEWHERRERRDDSRGRKDSHSSRSRSRSRSPRPAANGRSTPTGPRNYIPRGPAASGYASRPMLRRRTNPPPLPLGWFPASHEGRFYYYSASGQTTWDRPTMAATQPPPPPKTITSDEALQRIIDACTKEKPKDKGTPKAAETPTATSTQSVEQPIDNNNNNQGDQGEKGEKGEKWRTYSEEKRRKVYENTLSGPIREVMSKYKDKLPREDLKRFAKEVGKSLVKSDFKHNRVEDPTQITSKQERQVKAFVKNYFDKAVVKKEQHDRRKEERQAAKMSESQSNSQGTPATLGTPATPATPFPDVSVEPSPATDEQGEDDEPVNMDISDDDEETPILAGVTGGDAGPPPPPPPPPEEMQLPQPPLVVADERRGSADTESPSTQSG